MRFNIDGCDYFESLLAFKKAFKRTRNGMGPSLIVSNVVRLLPHSSSDDHRKYRTDKDIDEDAKKDPINLFIKTCCEKFSLNPHDFEKINNSIDKQINDDLEWALKQDNPDKNSYSDNLFSSNWSIKNTEPNIISEKTVLVDSINHALDEELSHNEKMIVYGQDVAGGKGGVFTATRGLTEKHTNSRVFNAPLAESSIVGTAIGMATLGYKPVVEIQFGDYVWTAMMQIRNELATLDIGQMEIGVAQQS